MSSETERGEEPMEKINVRVPAALLEDIEETYQRRGYASKSEAIRDALRDWVNPPVTLSEDIVEEIRTDREERDPEDLQSLEDVAEKFDVDLDE